MHIFNLLDEQHKRMNVHKSHAPTRTLMHHNNVCLVKLFEIQTRIGFNFNVFLIQLQLLAMYTSFNVNKCLQTSNRQLKQNKKVGIGLCYIRKQRCEFLYLSVYKYPKQNSENKWRHMT